MLMVILYYIFLKSFCTFPGHFFISFKQVDTSSSSRNFVWICFFFGRVLRPTAYQKAEEEYKRKQEEGIANLKEAQKKREERSQAIARYRTSKAEVFKKLSKKTKKGQPVMKGRIEILLDKLQRDLQSWGEYADRNWIMFHFECSRGKANRFFFFGSIF
jgi:hypothetical protein